LGQSHLLGRESDQSRTTDGPNLGIGGIAV
jgi:hypothetical protein